MKTPTQVIIDRYNHLNSELQHLLIKQPGSLRRERLTIQVEELKWLLRKIKKNENI